MSEHEKVGDEAPPISILSQIGRGIKKDQTSRYLSVYLGMAVVIVFLFTVSVIPQLSQKLGTLQTKKQSQESKAATLPLTSKITVTADQSTVYVNQRVGITWKSAYTSCWLSQTPLDSTGTSNKVTGSGYINYYPKQATTYTYTVTCGNTTPIGQNFVKVRVVAPQPPPAVGKISPCYPLGDVDNDYYVTSKDADLVLTIVSGSVLPTNLPLDYLTRADVDGKQGVTSADSLLIKKYIQSTDPAFKFAGCAPLQYPL